jgi:signal transduction histidine kinase
MMGSEDFDEATDPGGFEGVGGGDALRRISEMAQLIGGLAHELRNPLSTMMINLKLMSEDLSDTHANFEDVRRRALQKVDRLLGEAQRLQSLFDEFMSLTGPYQLNRSEIDLCKMIGELVEFVRPMVESAGIEIRLQAPDEGALFSADENLLRQALLNLLINGQQAMPAGGVLTIRIGDEVGVVIIEVEDSGLGISAADQVRILRPFFSTKAEGNGLGLSITQRIVAEHGGALEISSELGKGTTVRLKFARGARN